jgi:hypothetical protein
MPVLLRDRQLKQLREYEPTLHGPRHPHQVAEDYSVIRTGCQHVFALLIVSVGRQEPLAGRTAEARYTTPLIYQQG